MGRELSRITASRQMNSGGVGGGRNRSPLGAGGCRPRTSWPRRRDSRTFFPRRPNPASACWHGHAWRGLLGVRRAGVARPSLHAVAILLWTADREVAGQLLPPDVFTGIAVSDDAAVSRGRFAQAQKCWAHLLRKAIQLTLLYPEKRHYQTFLDDLLTVYRDAKRAQQDGRLSAAGRERQIERLENRIWDVAAPHQKIWESPSTPDERDFANLVQELFRLVTTNELFTFVRHPDVDPTNNVSERELRGPALCRKTGRTNKTQQGAHRQSVITSVLRSLQKHLPDFTLSQVVTEVLSWPKRGLSLFRQQLAQAKTLLAQPPPKLARCG